jgi:UDP-glucose:(heptosyl)LPS alpha-1,3-glucosyltransferase
VKVALVTEWLDAWRGGAEKSTLQFMHHLIDRGVELHVFTRSRPSPAPGLQVHTFSGAAMSRTRRSMTFASRVGRRLRSESFDIVHAITPLRHADIYQPRGGTVAESIERNLALLGSRSAQQMKRCANRFNFKQRYMLSLEQDLFQSPDGPVVVAISDYVVRQLQRHYALPDERIRRIYNGVDPNGATPTEQATYRESIRREFDVAPDQCLVLLVAHNFRLKGLQRWMEALARLTRGGARDLRCLVVGKGETARWHRLATQLGVAELLTFTGPSERVHEFHCGADVFVHPTYYDPCSRVVLEAMAAGLPCVTTHWDGASEMIEDGVNGFVLPDSGLVEALVDRVDRLRDPVLRKSLGTAARRVVDTASMSRHASEMLDLYGDKLAH